MYENTVLGFIHRADSRLPPSQWEPSLQSNAVSHWLGANLDSALYPYLPEVNNLTHWGRVTHICVRKLSIIGSDNGLSPGRRQAIIWTNAGILLIWTLGTNFSEILIEIHAFSFKKMHLKMSSAKWRPFCLGLNVLTYQMHFSLQNPVWYKKSVKWHHSLPAVQKTQWSSCKVPYTVEWG